MSEKTASVPPTNPAPPYTPDPPAGSSSSTSSLIGSGIMNNVLNPSGEGDLPARVDDPQPRQSLFDSLSKWSNGSKDVVAILAVIALLYSVVTGTMGATGWGTPTASFGGSSGLVGVTDTNGLWCKAVDGKIECVEQAPIKHNFPTAGSLCRVRNDGDELSMECDVDPDEFRRPYGVPIGSIQAFGGHLTKIPPGWLHCNGSELSATEYPELADVLGTAWGDGVGINNFLLPDLRGQFLRGVDGGRNAVDQKGDPDVGNRTFVSGAVSPTGVGSFQDDRLEEHDHPISDPGHSHSYTYHGASYVYSADGPSYPSGQTVSTTSIEMTGITATEVGGGPYAPGVQGVETRPVNSAVHYIIKARHE